MFNFSLEIEDFRNLKKKRKSETVLFADDSFDSFIQRRSFGARIRQISKLPSSATKD